MATLDVEDKTRQLEGDEQYRQLANQHQLLERRLTQLTELHYLSVSEQLEESTLKKQKLALKDRMAELLR
jgi:uncharacterized protein YdcH (DUF465 family)